jgi:hypothetical protein
LIGQFVPGRLTGAVYLQFLQEELPQLLEFFFCLGGDIPYGAPA